jgi:hypothetical protein
MSHLREAQFEDILQGRAKVPEHLGRCPQCLARLNEKRALVRRMCKAFSSIHTNSTFRPR